MKKRILSYRTSIDQLLENPEGGTDWERILKSHLEQIAFFQHERLIHLIVTALVAILMIMCIGIAIIAEQPSLFLLALPLFILLVPYLGHYYLLENEVQKMYVQYDRILLLLDHAHNTLNSEQTS